MTRRRLLLLRLGCAFAVLAAFSFSSVYLYCARRESARCTMPMPRAEALVQRPQKSDAPLELGVAIRLIDLLGSAQISIPRQFERPERGMLTKHWRRHPLPYAGYSGELQRLVQSVGLTRPAQAESSRTAETRSTFRTLKRVARPGAGVPTEREHDERDMRTFGLGEGTYDQRECFVVAAPSSLRFKLRVPSGASLRLAPAVLGPSEASFTVTFRPVAGAPQRILGTANVRGPSKRFEDWAIDLEAAGVSDVDGELELSTEVQSRETAITLWGNPVIVAPTASHLPYNVLFVIVDAMRTDAISASHDAEQDRKRKNARYPALDAWFDELPEVAPELDRLAANGAIWSQSWSAAMWTRPSTVSLLTGMRAGHTGLENFALELLGNQRRNFYASRPPLLPLMMRRGGATTTAIVNNMYLSGSVGVGVDFGFESVIDHRMQAQDTRRITNDALRFLTEQGKERFFLLLNYASPHAPYVPPPQDQRAVRAAPNAPADYVVRNYLAEIHKDDAAIGRVLAKLDQLELREKTLVVVTADHGEAMSEAHDAVAVDVAQGVPSGRFTHLSTMWEEAARVPIIMALPGKIPPRRRLDARVQAIDILPTILELEGLPIPPEVDGRSLVPGLQGKAVEPRPVIIEGRGARAIIDEHYHLIVRDPVARRLRRGGEEYERAVELFDLEQDPGERRDVAAQRPDVVARLRERLERALLKTARKQELGATNQRLHFRFATAGEARQLDVVLRVKNVGANVTPIGIDSRAIRSGQDEIRVRTATAPDRAIGFDLELPSTVTELAWEASVDAKRWPREAVFAGPLGLRVEQFANGWNAESDLALLESPSLPHIAATEELGMFITREPAIGPTEVETSAEAQLEAQQAMQAWGYARKPMAKKVR